MISKRALKLIQLCRCDIFNLKSASLCNRQRFLENSIATSSTNYRGKISASEALKIQNDFFLQEKEKYEDTFGNIENFELRYQRVKDDPDDIKEYERVKQGQGKLIKEYIKEIQSHLENNQYEKAVKVLEIDMVNDSKPIVPYIYKMLIAHCGREGNLKEAYRLYTNFKKRNGKVSGGMYTSLFNACANCQNSYYALEKASNIREYLMNDKNFKINLTNYNAMLKAFGRHGDLPSCFKIVDEVLERRDKPNVSTYCFLLQACISDKNSGLRHALLTWRKMLQYSLRPTIYEFNLMLRCVRDCFFGEAELMNDLIRQIQTESEKFFRRKVTFIKNKNETKRTVLKIPVEKEKALKLWSQTEDKENSELAILSESFSNKESECHQSEKSECSLQREGQTKDSEMNCESEIEEILGLNSKNESKISSNVEIPNLLAITPSIGSVLSFGNMTKSYERLLCFGGVKGFLKTMSDFKVAPDKKTFTLLLEIAPPSDEAENAVIVEARSYNVKLDTAFFNVLIKRRSCRSNSYSIQDALKEMQSEGVSPDIITFGVLAIGCSTHERGIHLIETARNFGIRLNSEILGALLSRAGDISDFKYVKTILNAAKEDQTTLSPRFLAQLSKIVKKEKALRKSKEIDDEEKTCLSSSENLTNK